jgi:hypothetical protein
MQPSRTEPAWTHDGVDVCVAPAPTRTLLAGVPVLVSLGMLTVAMGTSALAMLVPEMAVDIGLTAALALTSPVPLWLTARWSAPTRFHAGYAGVCIGRRQIPASTILSADIRRATAPGRCVVHLLLDDGRILRTPPVRPEVAEAVKLAYARPAEVFAGQLDVARATRRLASVRPIHPERADRADSPV